MSTPIIKVDFEKYGTLSIFHLVRMEWNQIPELNNCQCDKITDVYTAKGKVSNTIVTASRVPLFFTDVDTKMVLREIEI